MTNDNEISGNPYILRATADSHFSWLRTRMSIESTLLAWVRMAASLISFGFTIFQFFQRFPIPGKSLLPNGPRDMGLALILAGIIALAVATWQYRKLNQYLMNNGFEVLSGTLDKQYRSPTPAMAVLLFLIGLFAFATVVFRF